MGKINKDFLRGGRAEQFEILQHCLAPRSQGFTDTQRQTSLELINDFFRKKPSGIRVKLNLFLHLIQITALLTRGKKFKNLLPTQQVHVLTLFFDSPLSLLRKGFWGLNALAKMGVYGQPSVYENIGYKKKEIA